MPHSFVRKRIGFLIAIAVVASTLFWFWARRPDPDAMAAHAYDAVQNGDFDTARRILRELHEYNPADAEVVESLVEICLLAGDDAAAIDWLLQLPNSPTPKAVSAAFRGAQMSMTANYAGRARKCLDRCLRLDPNYEPARRLLIHLELILTRWEAMLAQIAELDERGQATPADVALFCVGRNFYWEDDSHLEWLQACVRKAPDECLTRAALAYYYNLQNRRTDAIELLRNSDDRQTDFEGWRLTLGLVESHISAGDVQRAHQEILRLPSDADALLRTWLAYARIFTEKDEFDLAIIAYENAFRLSPFDPEPVSALSRLLKRKGKHDSAAIWAHKAQLNSELWQILSHAKPLAAAGPSAETVMRMGRLLQALDRHREAIICFESVYDHVEFGAEAKRLAEATRMLKGPAPTLAVAALHDLDRSIPRAGVESDAAVRDSAGGSIQPIEHDPTVELRDIAAEVGIDFKFFRGDAKQDSLAETLGGGVGVIDFDMDDWPDLFFTQGTTTTGSSQDTYSNRLYRNFNGARAVDVTNAAGLSHGGYGQGSTVADFNEDGFPDLFIGNNGENALYENNGDGTFREVTREAGIHGTQWSTSATFADFDRDGDLDLYSVNYVHIPDGDLKPCRTGNYFGPCRVMDYSAEQDVFWVNQGDGTFKDGTDTFGIRAANGKGLGVVSADFDSDGWIDLFVGNDTTGNYLFHNLGTESEGARVEWRGFQEMGVLVGVAFNRDGKGEACMGIACEDLNHDGTLDLFVTNYELETNTVYANLGSLGFEDQTHRLGLADASRPMLSWGAQFIDIDADRYRDLFIANGHLYEPPMHAQLFLNRSSVFTEISSRAGQFFESKRFGRSVAVVDWNRDLAADLVVSHLKSPTALLANSLPDGNRLTVRLIGVESTRHVQAAEVSVTAGDLTTCFLGSSHGGYFASNENDVKIGLGPHKHAETLEVRWPSGRVQTWSLLPAGRKYALLEGRSDPVALEPVVDDASP